MKINHPILVTLLLISVGLNLYLLTPFMGATPLAVAPIKDLHKSPPTGFPPPAKDAARSHLSPDLDGKKPRQAKSRNELFRQANQWFTNKHFKILGRFLQDYLKQHPQDIDFLILEAKMKVETSLLSDAIEHYYSLLRFALTGAQQQAIDMQIQQLTSRTISQLTRTYSWEVLAVFVEPLLQLAPTNRLYILSLATAYAQQYQGILMENILGSLPFDDPDAQKIRQIIASQQIAKQEPVEALPDHHQQDAAYSIPLSQYRDQFVLQGKLSGNDIRLLIDTGASITAISKQYFAALSHTDKINYVGRFKVGTAAGTIMAPMYQFADLSINQIQVQNISVMVLPMSNLEHSDGLLGMNFLREFDFKIDQDRSVMLIKQ
jgi:clan AA aspartic protease (TIGR02281 family)